MNFSYTLEETRDLAEYLRSRGHEVLADFLETSDTEGFSVPGTLKDARLYIDLENLYPGILSILDAPKEDLPLYLNEKVYPMESKIATWRLKIGK